MKLDYTISRVFQEMSLSELETRHQLCELERTQILKSFTLAVLKIPYAGDHFSRNRSNFIDYAPRKFHPFIFLKIRNATKSYLFFI